MEQKAILPNSSALLNKAPGSIIHMLATPKIRWRTAFTYAIIILLLMLGLGFYLAMRVESWYAQETEQQWQQRAQQLAVDPTLRGAWPSSRDAKTATWQESLAIVLHDRAALFGIRLSAFTRDGLLIADSHFSPRSARSTVAETIAIDRILPGSATSGYDSLLGHSVTAIWVPIAPVANTDYPDGLLRLHIPVGSSTRIFIALRNLILPLTAVVALVIICMMVFQAERAAYTLRRLTKVAEQITAGDLSARTLSISGGEVGQFVRAFNRMADKLQAQMAKRAREKDRLHTVLHTMTDGVLLLNRHNYVRLLNDAAAQILHISAERALKRSFTQTVRDHRFVEVFTRCQQSGTTESAILELEPDVVIRMVVTPFLRGKDRGHLVVLQNLSRMHQLQMARRDFVSNISHELRTPLASLRALVETLSDGAIDDKVAAQRFLHHMEVEVDALTQMVQELLELSRIESGNAKLELASVSAATLLNQSSDRLRAQAERAEITLLVDAAETLPAVRVDVGRMQQVITNLIHNAIKFTQSGGTITISAKLSRADKITVAVRDSGVGIAHDDLPRIFERFYKADRARAGGGTGLGLAIAKHIVQAHGGTIWAESTPGKGSTFYFTLCTASSSATTSTTDSLTQ